MTAVITNDNVNQFQLDAYPLINKIKWKAGPLDIYVLRRFSNVISLCCKHEGLGTLIGLKGCPQLRDLDCDHNQLASLTGIEYCPQLRNLVCDHNQLTSLTGIEYCPQLESLDCSFNRIISLTEIEHCKHLLKLCCIGNHLESLAEIRYCPQLRELYVGVNRIKSLAAIEYCPDLRKLHITGTMIRSLTGIDRCPLIEWLHCGLCNLRSLVELRNCTQLQELLCTRNRLTRLTGLETCIQLVNLQCDYNRLETLAGIEDCIQLVKLQCDHNQLETLAGIENFTQLQELRCWGNQLVSLDHVVYLRHLRYFDYGANPLDIQTIQTQRFINRFGNARGSRSIYADAQSVHDTHIQKTVCESIRRLLTDPKPEFSTAMILESSLPERAVRLLLEYCDDQSVHSRHLLTYAELLAYIWGRICRSEHTTELIKILGEQICDSECKCFTGRFNRTLSVLIGFYPDIIIEIADSSRIGAIILAIQEKINPYDALEHYRLASQALIEAGYDGDTIRPWLEAIA